MSELKPGKDTSEYKLTVKTVAALVVTVLVAIVASGLIPDEHLALKIINGVIALAGALGIAKVTSTYSAGRAQVKATRAGTDLD